MSLYSFVPAPAEFLNEAWRPLDRALYRWVVTHEGSTLLASVAAWASLADGNGDTALSLAGDDAGRNGMPSLGGAEIAALRSEPMVRGSDAEGAVPVPFVLDDSGRFYLWRNHQHETAVVDAITRRRGSGVPVAVAEADIDALFHGARGEEVEPQRRAVRSVPGRKLFVLTGGPGTGKTTTVLRMLLMLQRQSDTRLTIQVAAPTGKAAQRLVQSLRKGKRDLLKNATAPLPADWHPLLENVPDQEALTLHRLLGYQPHANAFKRSAKDPVSADIVVIDEASMVDLAMLRSLLDAVRPEATLILVGDADQLTSVAAGSVMMDLVAALDPSGDGRGADDLVRLQHSFRAERHLVDINQAINAGSTVELQLAIAAAGAQARHVLMDEPTQLGKELGRWSRSIAATPELRQACGGGVAAAASSAEDAPPRHDVVAAALDALMQRQLLCALREGPYGAKAANLVIERLLRKAWGEGNEREWYAGRAVIVTRNDYAVGLFNGDVGICLADADGHLRVWFEGSPGPQPGKDEPAISRTLRSFAPNALPLHESAFAITVHKSQGSEYSTVAVLLPPDADNRILSRQLLYTAVSRAKRGVELWSADAALSVALTTPVRRASGLAERVSAHGCTTDQSPDRRGAQCNYVPAPTADMLTALS